ncbi:MAG: xanthine dehydrogenase family protein subunit M [Chloroflexi bacterium]|nr:xanthine dehydrogenase family protein subunit M [Chloroflexota bacterium]
MVLHKFDFAEPRSLEEVHALLGEHGDDAKLMAGGTALMLFMRQKLVQPAVIVSLRHVPGLHTVEALDGGVRIGALVTHRRAELDPLVQQRFPALRDTLRHVATIRIRNMGTLGGNLAHADPAQDPPAMLIALGASVRLAGPNGVRTVPLDEFFTGYYETVLEPGEVLTHIDIPGPRGDFRQAWSKFLPRSVDDYATVAVGVGLTLAPDGQRVADVRIGIGSAGETPIRARAAEDVLRGQLLTDDVLRAAGEAAAAECDPLTDVRGSAEYKREMVKVWVRRTIRKAVEATGGGRPA